MMQELELIEEGMLGAPKKASKWTLLYRRFEGIIFGIVAIVAFGALWEYIGTSGVMNPMFTSSPSLIYKAGAKLIADGKIWNDMYVSATEFSLGYGLSIFVGIPAGILFGWYRRLNYVADPFVAALYATPRVALLPLLIIWFGIGINSKIAVIFLGAVFPILMNTFSGVRTLDASLLNAARSFGANDRQIFTTIALPGSVPFILTGLRLGVGRALIGVVVGELYAATAGVGYLIAVAGATFQTDKVMVGVLIIASWGIIFLKVLEAIEGKFDAWRPQRAGAE
ncbi:MAG: ABC transporter permease [Chloroflexi bacterium]|nr:ABC transporter permease [Chloroflexota bacterium]